MNIATKNLIVRNFTEKDLDTLYNIIQEALLLTNSMATLFMMDVIHRVYEVG